MKKIIILLLVVSLGWIYNIKASESETPVAPQNYVQVACPVCGGSGTVFAGYNAWGYPMYQYCANCQGRGWVLQSSSTNFKGRVKSSCNIRSHKCSGGIDNNNDGWCDICYKNGYKCHMADHQPR